MRRIDRLFKPFLKRHRIKDTIVAAHICSVAREVLVTMFGDDSSDIRVRFVKNNTLHLECLTAAATSDLHMIRHDIRLAINDRLNKEEIDRIHISQA